MNTRKSIITGAMALGLLAGSAGIASAFTAGRQADPSVGASDPTETQDAREPALDSSIQTADDEGVSEADEATTLAGLATIAEADATKAALDANPGATPMSAKLENDNGSVVYEVRLTDAAGLHIDVKVDAGNGAVLAQEDGDEREGDESDGIDHENEGDESGNNGNGADENDEADEAPEGDETN